MMRIIHNLNLNNEYIHLYDHVFLIYPSTDEEMTSLMETIEDPIGYWLQENTKFNFIYLKIYSELIGGGYTGGFERSYDIFKSGEENINNDSKGNSISHYEVRLYSEDAIKFKLTWM